MFKTPVSQMAQAGEPSLEEVVALYKARHETIEKAGAEHYQDLLSQYQYIGKLLMQEYTATKALKQKSEELEDEIKHLREAGPAKSSRAPFAIVLIDGNGLVLGPEHRHVFRGHFLVQGRNGGHKAAALLQDAAWKVLRTQHPDIADEQQIQVRVYGNVGSLAALCFNQRVTPRLSTVADFATGFSSERFLCDFIDVGTSFSAAKIIELFRMHLKDRDCRQIFVSPVGQNGHQDILRNIGPDDDLSRITLIEGPPMNPAVIPINTVKWEDLAIFRPAPTQIGKRVLSPMAAEFRPQDKSTHVAESTKTMQAMAAYKRPQPAGLMSPSIWGPSTTFFTNSAQREAASSMPKASTSTPTGPSNTFFTNSAQREVASLQPKASTSTPTGPSNTFFTNPAQREAASLQPKAFTSTPTGPSNNYFTNSAQREASSSQPKASMPTPTGPRAVPSPIGTNRPPTATSRPQSAINRPLSSTNSSLGSTDANGTNGNGANGNGSTGNSASASGTGERKKLVLAPRRIPTLPTASSDAPSAMSTERTKSPAHEAPSTSSASAGANPTWASAAKRGLAAPSPAPIPATPAQRAILPTTGSAKSTTSAAITTGTGTIPRNRHGQRLDPALPSYNKEEIDRVKKLKMCNVHYLRGPCPYGPSCKRNHAFQPSKSELESLAHVARMAACVHGAGCADAACIFGHRCPFPTVEGQRAGGGAGGRARRGECIFGEGCKFPAEMHGMDLQPVAR